MISSSSVSKLLHFFIIIIIPTLIMSQDLFADKTNCKIIYINNKFFCIINKKDNFNIYYYNNNPTNPDIKYTYESITQYKDILKVDDNKFIVYGLKVNYDFLLYVCSFSNDNINCNKMNNININFPNIKGLNGKIISGSKLILSVIDDDFKVYRIDFNDNAYNEKKIPNIIGKLDFSSRYIKDDLQCDSSNGNIFFCIFCVISTNTNTKISYYLQGEFDKSNSFINNIGTICEKCYFGNVIKVDESNKYLMCYQKVNNYASIICQYYTFKENNMIIMEDYKEIGLIDKPITTRAINLYIYNYSIIIQFDYTSNTLFCMTIICSLDLKINIQSHFVSAAGDTINIFNDENYMYAIYEESTPSGKVTKIKNQGFIKCNNPDTININNDNDKSAVYDFFKDHGEDDNIVFSLDSRINLYRDGEIIQPNGNNFIPNEDNVVYKFTKKEETGQFQNYYSYTNTLSVSYFVYFSLICPIKVIVCHSTCEKCNFDKQASSSQHFCKSCINNYYPKESESTNTDGFNCYSSSDEEVLSYYLEDNKFKPCHISCKTCKKYSTCESCNNNYYFKSDDSNKILDNQLCNTSSIEYYYLDYSVNINYKGEIINAVYKHCHPSCLYCNGKGNDENNNCIECLTGRKYPFNDKQCIYDHNKCFIDKKYWTLENNNIKCVRDCNKKIVLYGQNKGQCVNNCQDYTNPYSKTTFFFTLINCNEKSYCVPLDVCIKGKFYVDYEEKTCERIGECNVDFFDDTDPFDHDGDVTTDITTDQPVEPYDKRKDIEKRIKIIKIFTKDYHYTLWKHFDLSLIKDYIRLYSRESGTTDDNSIYLITTTKYKNFTITIYPLDIEEFVYDKILFSNNLIFANFTKTFPNFIEYEIKKKCFILIILLESNLNNSSINDINYYFYSFDEKNDDGNSKNQILIEKDTDLWNKEAKLEITYPLYNYNDSVSTLNERNKNNLVDNIKDMYNKYPNIELTNLSNPFYSDICYAFTSDVNTDMTLNDRRNEYYINKSLCEKNCNLIQLQTRELKKPRSVCSCDIKTKFSFYAQSGMKDEIPIIESYNAKAISCISEVFNKISISSNIIFWLCMIVIMFLISMVIAMILYGNKEIRKIFTSNDINDNVNDISDLKMTVSSKSNKKEEYDNKIDKKKEVFKSAVFGNKKVNKNSDSGINQQMEYLSAPINVSNPPKKKIIKKVSSEFNDKDLISNSEPSFFKNSKTNQIDKNDEFTDFSFDNVPSENKVFIDNLLKQRYMMENNYIKNPVEFEKMQRMQIMYRSIYYLDNIKIRKYSNSYDDILIPKINKNININIKKINHKNERNKNIITLLDGDGLFNDNKSNNNKSDIYDYLKIKKYKELNGVLNTSMLKEEKEFEGDDQFFFPLFEDDHKNNFNLKGNKYKKMRMNKNENNKENDNEKFKKNQKTNARKNDARTRLLKAIGRSNVDDTEEKKDGKGDNKNPNFRTQYDLDEKNIIKTELKKIAFGDDEPDSTNKLFKNKNRKNNTLISHESDYNNNLGKSNSNILKMKYKNKTVKDKNMRYSSKNENDIDIIKKKDVHKYNSKDRKQNNNYYSTNKDKNESSKEIDSNRKMINFQEEGNIIGDMGVQISDIDNLKKKNSNKSDIYDINNINNNNGSEKNSNENVEDFHIFNRKFLASSLSAFLDTELNKPILVEEHFFLYYWKYFNGRELCLVSFRDKKKYIPYFVRWSCFAFSLITIFSLNCFFFFESNVHKRYTNALEGKKNNIVFYFKNEFVNSFYVALISLVFKMVMIKLVLFRLFKIKKETKKLMRYSAEKNLNKDELKELQRDRVKFLRNYKIKLLIYFALMMALSLLFAYFCICYGGVFPNSISAFLLGFLFSFILTFILCAFFCFIIVVIYKIGKKYKNKCILSTYIVLSTMY